IHLVVDDENVGRHGYLSLATSRILGSASPVPVAVEWSVVPPDSGYSALDRSAAAKRRRIQAPRPPCATSGASNRSSLPPCSSRILPTMARPRPVPFSRVVTYGSSRRLRFSFGRPVPLSITSIVISPPSRPVRTRMRPRPSSAFGPAPLASLAFLPIFVD